MGVGLFEGDASDDLAAHGLGEIEAGANDAAQGLQKELEGLGGEDFVPVGAVGKGDADQLGDLGGPGPGGVDDPLGGDGTLGGLDNKGMGAAHVDAGDLGEGVDLHAHFSGGLGVAPQERPGEDDSIEWVIASCTEGAGVELGDDFLGFFGGQDAGGDAELVLQGDVALHVGEFGFGAGQKQVAALAKPDVDAELAGEIAANVDGFLHEADVELGGPLHADAAAVSARCAAGQVRLLQDVDIAAAPASEFIGQAKAHDAAADDDGFALRSQRSGGHGAAGVRAHLRCPFPCLGRARQA